MNSIVAIQDNVFKSLKIRRVVLFSVFFALLSLCSVAQQPIEKSSYSNPDHERGNYMPLKQGWFLGLDAGNTLFYGDVTLYNRFPKTKDYNKSAGMAYSIYGGKKFLFGLAAEIQLFKGDLKGEKNVANLYPRYFRADIMGYSVSAKYNLSQLIFRQKNDRSFYNRLSLFLTVGGGQAFFRSRLYKFANNGQWYLENVSGYTATGIDSAGIGQAGGLVADKAKTVSTIILPVGGKLNFKLNQKTDLVLDINYTTAFTDQLDSWTRSWTHKDRYMYIGLGLMHNFGTSSDVDIPDSDRFLKNKIKLGGRKKGNSSASAGDAYDDGTDTDSEKIALFKRKSSSAKQSKADKDLDIKLKLYELQLKLFEMQYLMQ